MKAWTSISIIVVAAITMGATPRTRLPWVRGLDHVVVATPAFGGTDDRGAAGRGCGAEVGSAQTLRAELASTAGTEWLSATYSGGIVVRDVEGRELFRHPGLPCEGSVDQLDAVAVGWVGRQPTIAVVATSGGRRETVTTVFLYRPGLFHHLDPVFTGVVETRADETVARGGIWLDATGLVYRAPNGGPHRYRYDIVGHTYVTTVIPEH